MKVSVRLTAKEFHWNLTTTVASIFKNVIFPTSSWDFEDSRSVELQLFNAFTDVLQRPNIDKINE